MPTGRLLVRGCCGLMLCGAFACASAATIYKCVDPQGAVTFQDIPCAAQARQTRLDATGQPLIDPGTSRRPASHAADHASRPTRHARERRRTRVRKPKPPMSWECHAADGEVFYRHTRCPSSVPGDGVVRDRHVEMATRSAPRRRRNAWGRVPVHGVKLPRAEACRRIQSAGAAGRDGHLRDDHVSTYDHLMGRDPCPDT